ncbi:MAG: hypothetical protein A4E53_03370 [Pelotomaculum sp. PtaB.Bin104]|nr:MAG: hypothetical protein A4E53_03370 [Pelotomaculum sp. PtaB.Bin104]
MRIIVGLLLILSMLAGCGKQSTFISPPTPDQAKGSLAYSSSEKVSINELLTELLNYRQKDLEETKRIVAIKDDARRKEEALKQWKMLWPFYQAWKERGGQDYAGIRLYGPVASGWMNEILLL